MTSSQHYSLSENERGGLIHDIACYGQILEPDKHHCFTGLNSCSDAELVKTARDLHNRVAAIEDQADREVGG